MEWNQSMDWESAQTVGNGYFEAVTLIWSPSITSISIKVRDKDVKYARFSSTLPRPSNEAQAVLRELKGTHIRSSTLSGNSMGRNDSVCGQIGVIRMAGISGCTNDPPADNYEKQDVSVDARAQSSG